ncbi:histidine phosphatase family protein [Cyanobium sp. Morenito 9A2]|uniref:SixA phosphatase family protein n=1 Tax=Cyanobium sp. Morenito 9A2 TaxID=2823718 RepID=UPI0020CBE74C|nr:histidine phosphatase family protein [Cyanobium sp. Morenito 9A2]MCP9849944.1 histidine phosphatase family protein [Cyanobium sp. Morenito 9A2]
MGAHRELLLLRHGRAQERTSDLDDTTRALTPEGRRRSGLVLERLLAIGLRCDHMVSSPLVRARQTAELALAAGLVDRLEISSSLAPGGSPEPLLRGPWRRLALVGHEPDLSELAARLLDAPAGSLRLRKAGVVLLGLVDAPASAAQAGDAPWPPGGATLQLLLSPRSLGL